MRQAQVTRKTGETDIALTVNLDGTGRYDIRTGVGFFDHMLTGFARHGKFDLTVTCTGDTWVDDHHTVEDVGICLGQAFAQALGEITALPVREMWLYAVGNGQAYPVPPGDAPETDPERFAGI